MKITDQLLVMAPFTNGSVHVLNNATCSQIHDYTDFHLQVYIFICSLNHLSFKENMAYWWVFMLVEIVSFVYSHSRQSRILIQITPVSLPHMFLVTSLYTLFINPPDRNL